MSIYLFKTEEFYGGQTKVFTDKAAANAYLEAFIQQTNFKIDAVIEEHIPNVPTDHHIYIQVVRNDGWADDDQKITGWTPTNSTY